LVKLAYAHDGTSIYDALFLNELKERYDVYVLTFHPSPIHVPLGVKTIKMADPIPETNLHPFEGMRKHLLTPVRTQILKKNLARIKPDVLIGCWASTYGFYSAYSNFHPFILFVWGSDVLVFPKKYFPLKPFVVYSIRKADVVIIDSEVQKEATIKLGCEPQKIVEFPWVNLNGFEKNESQRRRIRTEFGWTDDDIVVASLRNHKSIYGVGYLMEAIPQILKRNNAMKFLILGEGPLTKTFKAKVHKFIKSDQVKFVGAIPHENVADYLSVADIYVSTSFSDGTSASLLEAMACSLTPVVTEINGNKEWIQDGMNGLLVPPANHKSLTEKILLLASDYELRKSLQKKAEETVRTRVNWQENIERLMKIIDKLVYQKTEASS
jgi:glycosyltransferase involved in cell wall biosynthesis